MSDWTANGRDAAVKAAVTNISPSMVNSGYLNQSLILQTMQLYQPQFQLADVQKALSVLDNNQQYVPGVLAALQTNGMSYYLGIAITQAGKIATSLQSAGGTKKSASPLERITPDMLYYDPNKPIRGGGGYNCARDGALIFAAGVAFATLSVMTLGSVDVLAGAAWAGIAAWGGLGTTGWGIGHVVAGCGF